MPLDSAIADTIRETVEATSDDTTEQPTGQDQVKTETSTATTEDAPTVDGETGKSDDSSSTGTDTATTESAEDAPDSYFGVDLSDLEPEARQHIVDELKERDKFVQKLLQRNAELEAGTDERTTERQVVEEPAEVSDEDLLKAFGVSPDDPMYEVKAEVMLPLAKQMQSMKQVVDTVAYNQQVEQELVRWNTELAKLETEYGKLPISREALIDYAVENNIFDPVDAYHRVTAPVRKQVGDAATKARQEALATLKKNAAGTVRPRTSTETDEAVIQAPTLKEAVALAAKKAEEKLGFTFGDAAGRGL